MHAQEEASKAPFVCFNCRSEFVTVEQTIRIRTIRCKVCGCESTVVFLPDETSNGSKYVTITMPRVLIRVEDIHVHEGA